MSFFLEFTFITALFIEALFSFIAAPLSFIAALLSGLPTLLEAASSNLARALSLQEYGVDSVKRTAVFG